MALCSWRVLMDACSADCGTAAGRQMLCAGQRRGARWPLPTAAVLTPKPTPFDVQATPPQRPPPTPQACRALWSSLRLCCDAAASREWGQLLRRRRRQQAGGGRMHGEQPPQHARSLVHYKSYLRVPALLIGSRSMIGLRSRGDKGTTAAAAGSAAGLSPTRHPLAPAPCQSAPEAPTPRRSAVQGPRAGRQPGYLPHCLMGSRPICCLLRWSAAGGDAPTRIRLKGPSSPVSSRHWL